MALPVKLQAIVDQMDMVSDEMIAYINRTTGDLVTLTLDDISSVEDDGDNSFNPDWRRETIHKAKQVLADDEYIELPDRFEIHEHKIMERFCYAVEDERQQNILLRAISGKDAFRRFKDRIYQEGVENEWFAFKNNTLKKNAADFLESKGITFIDKK